MSSIEKIKSALSVCRVNHCHDCKYCPYNMDPRCIYQMHDDALALLKEQEEWLRKFQKDKDKLCLEVSELKHKFHDAPPKFVSQGVVDQIRWERDTALSQLEQIGKGLGSKMDDIVALLKGQETVVRCKDCKWYDERISMCDNCGLPREQTFFCADGKRKEGR